MYIIFWIIRHLYIKNMPHHILIILASILLGPPVLLYYPYDFVLVWCFASVCIVGYLVIPVQEEPQEEDEEAERMDAEDGEDAMETDGVDPEVSHTSRQAW